MSLSNRALSFLMQSERRAVITNKSQLLKISELTGVPISEPIIKFQQEYGGFIFYAGLEPIIFSLTNTNETPLYTEDNLRPFNCEQHNGVWYFGCAFTRYSMDFHIAEDGKYYEDWQPVASSFIKVVERLAIYKELQVFKWKPLDFHLPELIESQEVLQVLGCKLVYEASDEYECWWLSDRLCVKVQSDSLKVWYQNWKRDDLIKQLMSLV